MTVHVSGLDKVLLYLVKGLHLPSYLSFSLEMIRPLTPRSFTGDVNPVATPDEDPTPQSEDIFMVVLPWSYHSIQ